MSNTMYDSCFFFCLDRVVTETPQKTVNEADSDGADDSASCGDLTTLNHHPRPMAVCCVSIFYFIWI